MEISCKGIPTRVLILYVTSNPDRELKPFSEEALRAELTLRAVKKIRGRIKYINRTVRNMR